MPASPVCAVEVLRHLLHMLDINTVQNSLRTDHKLAPCWPDRTCKEKGQDESVVSSSSSEAMRGPWMRRGIASDTAYHIRHSPGLQALFRGVRPLAAEHLVGARKWSIV